jgi:hypothetical protein
MKTGRAGSYLNHLCHPESLYSCGYPCYLLCFFSGAGSATTFMLAQVAQFSCKSVFLSLLRSSFSCRGGSSAILYARIFISHQTLIPHLALALMGPPLLSAIFALRSFLVILIYYLLIAILTPYGSGSRDMNNDHHYCAIFKTVF